MNVVVDFYNPWNAKLHRTVVQVCYEVTACDSAAPQTPSATNPLPPGAPLPIPAGLRSPSPLTSLTGMPIAPPT